MQTFFNLLRFVVIFASGLSLNAKILFVDDNASAGGNGLLWANAFNHLQDALSAATSGDEIWVAEGIYLPDQGSAQKQGDRMATFNLVNGVGLFGGFEGNESKREPKGDSNQTILSGEIDVNSTDWSIHVLSAVGLDKSSILQGFRVVNGYADQSESPHNRGGGMYIENGSPVIRGCSFVGNSAKEQGGAIYNASANSSFIDCNFSGNLAGLEGKNGYGGAMSHANSTPMLTNCVFSENNATYQGGGLWGIQMNGTISDSVFVANIVTGNGGGVFLINSSPSFSNCVFVGNFADYGAGSYQESASTVFHNNVFTENNATYRGGGLFFYKSTTTLNNCNVVTNYAGLEGGGLGISKLSSKIPTLNNSILWKNLSSGTESHGVTGDWNGSVSYPSIFQGWTGDNRAVATDPLFSNVSNPNGLDGIWFTKDDGFRLQSGSPAIDF